MTRNTQNLFPILFLVVASLTASPAFSAEPVSKSRLGSVAIGGRDTVAYHTLGTDPHAAAVKGAKSYIVKWKGAKWRFASEETSLKFKADPEKYSPAYNGFCANALSLGKGLLRTDGTHWEIFGDQLYLFYAASGRERWVDAVDITEFVKVADEEWGKLSRGG